MREDEKEERKEGRGSRGGAGVRHDNEVAVKRKRKGKEDEAAANRKRR